MAVDFARWTEEIKTQLVKKNVITRQQMDHALQIQKDSGGSLSEILITSGYIEHELFMKFISTVIDVPYVKLEKKLIDSKIVSIIPKKLAVKYKLIPVVKLGNTLTVAMTDPFNLYALDEIRSVTGAEIEPLFCDESDIVEAIESLFPEVEERIIGDGTATPIVEPKAAQEGRPIANIKIGMSGDVSLTDAAADFGLPDEDDIQVELDEQIKEAEDRSPVIKITNLIIKQAITRNASDIHIETEKDKLRVRYRIDGVLKTEHVLPHEMGRLIISRIKIMAQLNITERRLPQDGVFTLRFGEREIDGRVATTPTVYGESAIIRLLDQSKGLIDVDNIGLPESAREIFLKTIAQPSGFILVTGPTGSGKTTTLYAALNSIISDDIKIITVEDPVEYRIQGVNQIQMHHHIGLDFSRALRSILRQDPDVILVGEIRDKETAKVAIQAVLTGHLLFSTLHTTNSINSVIRLLDLGIDYFYLREVLSLVIAQRLVRRLCESCKEEYEPSERELDEAQLRDLTVQKGIFKPAGCPKCDNTGYKGRQAIFEFFHVNDTIRDSIKQSANTSDLWRAAKTAGISTLWSDAVRAVREGHTSIAEIKGRIPRDQVVLDGD